MKITRKDLQELSDFKNIDINVIQNIPVENVNDYIYKLKSDLIHAFCKEVNDIDNMFLLKKGNNKRIVIEIRLKDF